MPDEYEELARSVLGAPPPPPKRSRSRLPDLISFAEENELAVGSTTGGRHNRGSKHYSGNAIDIKGSGAFDDTTVETLKQKALKRGFLVRDERRRPPRQKVWGGPHVHIEVASSLQSPAPQKKDDLYRQLAEEVLSPSQPDDEYTKLARSVIEPAAPSPSPTPQSKRSRFEGVRAGAQGEAVREYPAMQARRPGIIERATEAIKPYVPGLTSLDTPAGIKLDAPRGFIRGVTLGATGEPRPITKEDLLADPDAEAKRNFAEGLGETVGAVVPYIGAGKVLSKVPALAKATRSAHIARNAATFGGVETAREGIHAIKTGEPMRPEEIAISTGIGAAMGGIAGVSPSMKRQVVAFLAPQIAVDVARGTPMDQAVQAGLTNLGFALTSGARGKTVIKAPRIRELRARLEAERVKEDARQTEGVTEVPQENVGPRDTQREVAEREVPVTTTERESVVSPNDPSPVGSGAQRFYHTQYGNVVKAADQTGARKGKTKIYVEGNPEEIHYPKTVDLRGRGNERMVPLKESASQPVEVLPEKPQQPPETKGALAAPLSPPETLRVEPEKAPSEMLPESAAKWTKGRAILEGLQRGDQLVDADGTVWTFNGQHLETADGRIKLIRESARAKENAGGFVADNGTVIDAADMRPVSKPETTSVEQGVEPKTIKGDAAQTPRDVPIESVSSERNQLAGKRLTSYYEESPTSLHDQAKTALRTSDGGLTVGEWRKTTLKQGGKTVEVAVYQPRDVKAQIRVRRIFRSASGEYYAEQMRFNKKGDPQEGPYTRLPTELQDALKNKQPIPEQFHAEYPELIAQPSAPSVSEGAQLPERGTPARSEPKVSEQPIREVINEATAQVRPESTIVSEGAGLGALERGTAPAPSKPEPSITSARKAMMAEDRAALDLPELPLAERKSWQASLDRAKPEKASLLADEVLKKPRALSDEETASIVVRAQQIKNEHSRVMKGIEGAKDPDAISAKRSEAEALEREFDRLTTATKASGTEKGRALASQKLTINQDFDLVSVLQRAKAAKGRELTGEERTKYEGMTKRIEELQSKLAQTEADALSKAIQKDIDRVRRRAKRGETRQALDEEFADLRTQFAQARMEAKGVQASGLAGLDPEGTLTPILLKMARNRVRAGVVKAEDVVDHVYGAVREHVEGTTKDDIRALLASHNLERDPLPAIKTRLGKQEAELTRRLKEKDFTAPPKRKPVVYDREAAELKARVEQLKRKVEAEIRGTDSRLDTILALRKAGMLTGLRTHGRNIGGTAAFQAFEEVSRVPGAIVDLVVSSVTKQRALGGPSPRAVARSSYEAATRGVQEARNIMRFGASSEELAKIDRPRELNSGSRLIDTYVNTVFRSLASEDKVFRTYAFKRSIEDQARIRSRNLKTTAKELADNPTPEMVSQAILDSEVATFNSRNKLAEGVEWVRKQSGPVGSTAIDLVIPFRRTPANIASRLLESTPLGLVKGGGQLIKARMNKEFSFEDQRKFSQTIGRSVTGSSLIALGYMLASKGLATGLYEEDYGDREVQKAAGRSPMAVKIGNTWHQIGAFSPIGNLIAVGAGLHREKHRPLKEGEEPPNLAAAAVPIAAKSVLEQPFLRGVSGVVDALESPGRSGTAFLGQTAASFVPTAVSDLGATVDNKRRQSKSIAEKVQSRIPFLRNRLPEEIDVFGKPLQSRRTAFLDPTLASSANNAPYIKELVRLDIGVAKTPPRPGESSAQHRERIIAQGKAMDKRLTAIVGSSRYRGIPDERKTKIIKDAIEDVRRTVNKRVSLNRPRREIAR